LAFSGEADPPSVFGGTVAAATPHRAAKAIAALSPECAFGDSLCHRLPDKPIHLSLIAKLSQQCRSGVTVSRRRSVVAHGQHGGTAPWLQ